ncbi:MAG TPA: hypothetical protein VG711_07055 [Phycisphaerales bacterium]|nr:hypothetical protein [Phycisphaerales bacterium]
MAALVLVQQSQPAQQPPQSQPSEAQQFQSALDQIIIVSATVVALEGNPRSINSTQHIDHVYCGRLPDGVDSFPDWSALEHFSGDPAYPMFELGQQGLWLLISDSNGVRRTSWLENILGMRWPARKGIEPTYDETLQFAEWMESLSKLHDIEQQVNSVQSICLSDSPMLSRAGIQLFARCSSTRFLKFTSELDLHSLSLSTQTTIDESICKLDRDRWINSPNRLSMISGWLHDVSRTPINDSVYTRINHVAQTREIDDHFLYMLIKPLAVDSQTEQSSRSFAIHMLGHLAQRDSVADDIFTTCISIYESTDDLKIRNSIAGIISVMNSLTPAQIATLLPLRDEAWNTAAKKEKWNSNYHDEDIQLATTLELTIRRNSSPKLP